MVQYLEIEYKEEYVELLPKEAYSHTIIRGVIVSIILAIVSLVVVLVLFPLNFLYLLLLIIGLVIVPVNIITYFVARDIENNVRREAKIFADVIAKLSEIFKTRRAELLETPPPPYVGIIKTGNYYIGISYYGYGETYVSILDPLDIEREEGYASIYIRKSRELLSTMKIDDETVKVYRLEAILPEPIEDFVIGGIFYSYEFMIRELDPSKIYRIVTSVFKEIKRLRELYPVEMVNEDRE